MISTNKLSVEKVSGGLQRENVTILKIVTCVLRLWDTLLDLVSLSSLLKSKKTKEKDK